MFKLIKTILLSVLALIAFVSCSAAPKKGNVLILGTNATYPPYEFVDETGSVVGFDIDVAERIAAIMGKKLVVEQMEFDALILSLKNKKIDFLMSGMSITQDRQKEIAMIPYNGKGLTEMQLIFWKQIPAGVGSIHDLKGQMVAVQSGTIQEELVHGYPDVESKSLDGIMELVMDLKYGKSVAVIVEPKIGNGLKYKYPEIVSLPLPLLPGQQFLGDGIGIRKDNAELIADIESCVDSLKESGELLHLRQKWFHEEE